MATIPEITDRLEAATEKAENASQIIYDVANGDESTEVPTASGPTPTLKKWFQDLGSSVEPMLAGIPARLDKAILQYQTKTEADDAASGLPDGQQIITKVANKYLQYSVETNLLVDPRILPSYLVVNNVVELIGLSVDSLRDSVYVLGFWSPGSGNRILRWDSSRSRTSHNGGTIVSPTVPFSGLQSDLDSYLQGIGETDPSSPGCWVVDNPSGEFNVHWFGARGDGARPSNNNGLPTGTDDTVAVKAAARAAQLAAFHPNFFVGNWGGCTLTFNANKAYVLSGDNPIGNTFGAYSDTNVTTLDRQNYFIDGRGALLLWIVPSEDSALIRSNEVFVRQIYSNFTLIPCGITGAQGWLYVNNAVDGRNATMMHRFQFVQTAMVGSTASSTTEGLKGLWSYTGNNLGDRLQTEFCSFSNCASYFVSSNPEAVSQRFSRTSFSNYMDGAVFFSITRHGSGFSVDGCELLMKGNNQTLLRTRYADTNITGTRQGNTYLNFERNRLEVVTGNNVTLADVQWGIVKMSDMTLAPGGLPNPDTPLVISRYTAQVTLDNCHIHGRILVGRSWTSNYILRRNFAVKLRDCQYSVDIASKLFVVSDDGATLTSLRNSLGVGLDVPPVIIEDTTTSTAAWEGTSGPTGDFLPDGLYFGYGTARNWNSPVSATVMIGNPNASGGTSYLSSGDKFRLPPLTTITSLKITSSAIGSTRKIRLYVGGVFVEKILDANNSSVELLSPGSRIVISDDNLTERLVNMKQYISDVETTGQFFPGFIEITYRRANGLNEVTTTETGGIRLTRII